MKNFGWIIAYLILHITTILFVVDCDQTKKLNEQTETIMKLCEENAVLKNRQSNLDWFERKIAEIDEYISWKDILLLNGYESVKPIERTYEELFEERKNVILDDIAMAEK